MRSNPLEAAPLRCALLVVLSVLLCGVANTSAAGSPVEAQASPAVSFAAPTAAHPFSDPVWLPLHTPARISCAKSNCTGGTYHGYWAIDFVGAEGAPVYAAGAGIFHVGNIDPSCTTQAKDIDAGTWVWVDHGGGKVTKYNHLNAIKATEGQRVTPATVIGTMGHSGDVEPCTTNYLHFEVRTGGVKGARVDPGTMLACTTSGRTRMPDARGATSWNDPRLPARQVMTPAATSGCIGDSWDGTPGQPAMSVRSGPQAATVTWSAPPQGADRVVVLQEVWSPSLRRYGWPTYVVLPVTSRSRTFTGLSNGRTYRYAAAFHNSHGNSAWSGARTVVPASVPSAPKAPRFLTSPTKDYIHFGWWKSADNGSAVTGYYAARRCMRNGVYGAWVYVTGASDVYYANFRGLSGITTCQVKVRAANRVGNSSWSTVSTIHKQP
jgi:hypothetical protein